MKINSKFKRCHHSKIQQIFLESLKFHLCSTLAKLTPSDLCFFSVFSPFLSIFPTNQTQTNILRSPRSLPGVFLHRNFHFLLLAQPLAHIYASSFNMENSLCCAELQEKSGMCSAPTNALLQILLECFFPSISKAAPGIWEVGAVISGPFSSSNSRIFWNAEVLLTRWECSQPCHKYP